MGVKDINVAEILITLGGLLSPNHHELNLLLNSFHRFRTRGVNITLDYSSPRYNMAADNNNNNEGLSTDELLAAGDPMSCKDIFWDALVANNEELAVRAGQTISVPNVVQQTFNFDEDEEGETLQVDDEGTLVAPIEPNSPSVVENAWNSSKPTSLTMVDYEAMCLCKKDSKAGKIDYRACAEVGCQPTNHKDRKDGEIW